MIRQANKYDTDKIIEFIKDFIIKTECQLKGNISDLSDVYIKNVIDNIFAGQGFILIDDKQTGILVAYKSPCFWNEKSIQLQEVMLHGYNKFVIAKLIKEYIKIAKEMLNKKEITHAVMASSKDINFERYGMKLLQYNWEIKWAL